MAYAAAAKLGYQQGRRHVGAHHLRRRHRSRAEDFDWNIQQFTITEDRQKAVDFSSPYYEAPQAVITYEGSEVESASTIAALQSAKLGAAVGSTSLDAAEEVIQPEEDVQVFSDNAGAVTALKNKQVDAIVVDLPTAPTLRTPRSRAGRSSAHCRPPTRTESCWPRAAR